MQITFRKLRDTITPELLRIANSLKSTQPLMLVMGNALANALHEYYEGKNSNFWSTISDAVGPPQASENHATVSIDSPILIHKITGGPIVPKRGKALAIPYIDEAREAGSPGTRQDDLLRFVPIKTKNPYTVGALVERQKKMLKRVRGGNEQVKLKIWYWLVTKVEQNPDPNALPPMSELEDAVYESGAAYLRRQIEKQ